MIFIGIILFTCGIFGQNFDYRLEEAPVVSWNRLPWHDARLMACAGVSLLAQGPFTATVNPALVPTAEKFTLGISSAGLRHEAFQYWGVNQGVVAHPEPLSNRQLFLNGLAATYNIGNLHLSAGWYLSALRQFPSFSFRRDYDYEQYDDYSGDFAGRENTFFTAAALKLTGRLDIGIKLEYSAGDREVEMVEFSSYYYLIDDVWVRKDTALRQQELHERSHFAVTLGAVWKISSNWTAAAAIVLPFDGEVKRTVTRIFDNQTDRFDITQRQTGSDPLYNPPRAQLGTSIEIPLSPGSLNRQRLLLGTEAVYTSWSGYQYVFFGDTMDRDMRDTVALAIGAEYGSLSSNRDLFIRLGFRLDPQPLREPTTTLYVLTGGLGLRLGSFSIDVGTAYYTGTAGSIRQNHLALTTTLGINLAGGEQ